MLIYQSGLEPKSCPLPLPLENRQNALGESPRLYCPLGLISPRQLVVPSLPFLPGPPPFLVPGTVAGAPVRSCTSPSRAIRRCWILSRKLRDWFITALMSLHVSDILLLQCPVVFTKGAILFHGYYCCQKPTITTMNHANNRPPADSVRW